jgi:hypothetical protein
MLNFCWVNQVRLNAYKKNLSLHTFSVYQFLGIQQKIAVFIISCVAKLFFLKENIY